MPPQQPYGLLDGIDGGLDLGAHAGLLFWERRSRRM
jgi:hypothetical protein